MCTPTLFFGSYGYRSVAIFRVHAAERQAIMSTLWKDLPSAERLSFWPSVVALPFIPAPCGEVVRSSCLGGWIIELDAKRFASARFQLRSRRQRGLEVFPSIWESSALPGRLRRLSVTWRAWDATQGAAHFTVLALCTHSSLWPLFEKILANFSVCHELLDLFFFVIREASTFRQGKVVVTKSASFFW